MTLSNFDWTDKDSVKWFVLLPTGHEGPYSLKNLAVLLNQKKMAPDVKVWAEGLTEPLKLKDALNPPKPIMEEIPDLPPLPIDDAPPPLPIDDKPEEEPLHEPEDKAEVTKKDLKTSSLKTWGVLSLGALVILFFGLNNFFKGYEKIEIHRLPKMTVNLHQRILEENVFGGWDKKIFFKEYLPDDHSHIWLVTSSFQTCNVSATFKSIKNKLLSLSDESVSFISKTRLSGHVAEFASFEFTQGNKIIPGLYEMDIKATECQWEGFIPKVMNLFSGPDKEYQARTKVILFSKGAEEFNSVLDRLLKKKLEKEEREKNQSEIFWQDLQQKLETLQAITLQIEQLFLDFTDKDSRKFSQNLKPMVDQYTRQFGSFLTSFVVENENYFKNLDGEARGTSQKRNYELIVKSTAKKIGFESMKFIEEFQALKKNPRRAELDKYSERMRKTFSQIKKDINEKLAQISEDRGTPQ